MEANVEVHIYERTLDPQDLAKKKEHIFSTSLMVILFERECYGMKITEKDFCQKVMLKY